MGNLKIVSHFLSTSNVHDIVELTTSQAINDATYSLGIEVNHNKTFIVPLRTRLSYNFLTI